MRKDRSRRPLPLIMSLTNRCCLLGYLITAGISDNSVRPLLTISLALIVSSLLRGTLTLLAVPLNHYYGCSEPLTTVLY